MSVHRLVPDVPRWLDPTSEASAELRALLDEASALPDDGERIGRLRSRLEPWLAAGATVVPLEAARRAAGQLAPSAAPAVGVGALGKLALVLVGAGAGFAVSAAVSMSQPSPVQRASEPAPISAPAPVPRSSAQPSATSQAQPSATSQAQPSATSQAQPSATSEAQPSATSEAQPSVASRRLASAQSRSAPATSSASPTAAPTLSSEALAEQAMLLARARSRIESDPALALRLLGEHARRFPNSVLAEERSLFVIRALMRAGRPAEAQGELARLQQSAPASPHLAAARRTIFPNASSP
jgi:hypothetical protein